MLKIAFNTRLGKECLSFVKKSKKPFTLTEDLNVVAHGFVHSKRVPFAQCSQTSTNNSLLLLSTSIFKDTYELPTPSHSTFYLPNSPNLHLHFKLEEVHFLFQSVRQTSSSFSGSNHAGSASQSNFRILR